MPGNFESALVALIWREGLGLGGGLASSNDVLAFFGEVACIDD